MDEQKFKLVNLVWREDKYGFYWVGDVLKSDGTPIGRASNYYDDPRPSKEEALAYIQEAYELVERNTSA